MTDVVLAGFAESLAAIETIWDLLDHGFTVHAFTRDGRRPPIAADRRVVCHGVPAPELDAAAAIDAVARLADHLEGAVLMPLDDVALWVLDAVWQSRAGSTVAGPTGRLALLSLNKAEQINLARDAGFHTPRGVVSSGAGGPEPDFPPPWIIKPVWAVENRNGRLTRGRTEFASSTWQLKQTLARRDDDVLIQPVLRGVGEGIFGHATKESIRNLSAHTRIRMMNPSGSGSSACRSISPGADLIPAARVMMERAGWTGLFMLEFLRDAAGVPWFMELNGRTWGSMVLATRRGLSYPTWAVRNAIDADAMPDPVVPSRELTARHVGRELLHLGFVARGRSRLRRAVRCGADPDADVVQYPKLSQALLDVLRWSAGERPYNLSRGHLSVLVIDTWQTVQRAFRPSSST